MTRRVVITGIGLVSPIGNDLASCRHALQNDCSGVRYEPQYEQHPEMLTRLCAPVTLDESRWNRKVTRTMGRVARLALAATEDAVAMSGLPVAAVQQERTGLAYGSTHGSTAEWETFALTLKNPGALLGLGSSAYLKFSTHTCAANLAVHFKIHGRVIPTCSACVSASQAIGLGYESIRSGAMDVMLCGGAEELHYISTGVFDVLQATSTKYNATPSHSPRPFDANRDGLVVGEGAGTLVLEELEHAQARGATILAELTGFGMSCDGTHITAPSAAGMARAMRLALSDAHLAAGDIDYINAHGTGTTVGDTEESKATFDVYGNAPWISSTKGFTGHTLAACGALEAAFVIDMLQHGYVAPSRNLDTPDPHCAALRFVRGEALTQSLRHVVSNNFAFGGINTSLVFSPI